MTSLGVCVILVKLLPYQNIFCSKMLTRRKEKKQINICTTHGHQSNLLKCSTGLHVHQRDLHSHTAVIKLSPVTLHVDTGFLLFAGPSSKVTKDMILSSSSFLFQVICSPASHDVVFCNEFASLMKLLLVTTCYTSVSFLTQALL